MSTNFRIEFGYPKHQWIDVTLSTDDVRVISSVASTCPYDSIDNLVCAIMGLLKGLSPSYGYLSEEPAEKEFLFTADGEMVTLTVTQYYRHGRTKSEKCEELFQINGTMLEICMPFWRGLRRLQSTVPSEEYIKEWAAFPTAKLDEMTQLIQDLKMKSKNPE